MSEISVVENGSVWIENGKIIAVDTNENIRKRYQDQIHSAEHIDATGKIVTPGLVDPHTHLVHAGTRENEYAMRLEGKTYMEIMNAGGGIHATTRATQQASYEALYEQSKMRLNQFLHHGVTTVEAKSGYGLTLEDELKQLVVTQKLKKYTHIDIINTYLFFLAVTLCDK